MQLEVLTRKRDQFKNSIWWALNVSLCLSEFHFYCSELIAINPTDRQWYLNRIRDNSCKISQGGFSETPKPFNKGCNTSLELTMVIFAILGWGELPIFQGKINRFDSSLGWIPGFLGFWKSEYETWIWIAWRL